MTSIITTLKSILSTIMDFFSFGKNTLSDKLNIYIKSNTGNTLCVDLDPQWEIKDVKEIVAPRLGLKPNEVKIIFAGKELSNTTKISECDLGQQSILHAIRIKTVALEPSTSEAPKKVLLDSFTEEDSPAEGVVQRKNHFYVFCPTCSSLRNGKLRVRCAVCKSGAFTVNSDPQSWDDVLKPRQILGLCESTTCLEALTSEESQPIFAEFYFKCGEHVSLGENDTAVPLYLIRPNLKEFECLACGDVSDPILVFPCENGHVSCLDCFKQYCSSRLQERRFHHHWDYGYTLPCPMNCPDSFIKEIHHFRLLSNTQYSQYQRFAVEEFVLKSGGVLCPQPGCGMGIIPDPDCNKITCLNGCGYVFCRLCLQGYHIGECETTNDSGSYSGNDTSTGNNSGSSGVRWDEASKKTIRVLTKPCPKCRTPTERDGGCMHMVCTRSGCDFHWCWVCQTSWTRECMGSHWFG